MPLVPNSVFVDLIWISGAASKSEPAWWSLLVQTSKGKAAFWFGLIFSLIKITSSPCVFSELKEIHMSTATYLNQKPPDLLLSVLSWYDFIYLSVWMIIYNYLMKTAEIGIECSQVTVINRLETELLPSVSTVTPRLLYRVKWNYYTSFLDMKKKKTEVITRIIWTVLLPFKV